MQSSTQLDNHIEYRMVEETQFQEIVGESPPRAAFLHGTAYQKIYQIFKVIMCYGFGMIMFIGTIQAYIVGFTFIHDEDYYIGFGVYGSIAVFHLFLQSIFAFANKRRNIRLLNKTLKKFPKIGIQISCYKEDPNYLRLCLQSLKDLNYPKDKIKIMLCIDGNKDDDLYMSTIFKEVFELGHIFRWKHNYHYLPPKNTRITELKKLVENNYAICCLQK